VSSKSEGRRAVEQGGVMVDGEKVADIKQTFPQDAFAGDGVVVKRGKKNFRRVKA
ncbi:MAG: tyrosine--tRNA ligase, partial [Peptococcaceae bacterium]|nr:tyrosine--tRNA ligase [Peptococcaceae bacterium]